MSRDGASLLHIAPTVSATVIGVLPVFLIGGLGTFVRGELAFDEATLGLLVASFFAVSAIGAIPSGRVADRVGARVALVIGVGFSIVSLLGVALLARTVTGLFLFLAAGGVANAIMQPAANLALTRSVDRRHLGLAFGIKQSAVPVATLLAGLAVPVLGLTLGWRWAFSGGAAAAVVLLGVLARRVPDTNRSAPSLRVAPRAVLTAKEKWSLRRIGIATACGFIPGNSLGAFYIPSADLAGVELSLAGLLLSAGGVLGVATRMYVGWRADRATRDHLRVAGVMMLAGSGGFLALGHAHGLEFVLVGTLVAFSAGWGWTGLVHLGVSQHSPQAVASASGIVNSMSLLGALSGPALFGWVAEHTSYAMAWSTVSGFALIGGALLLWERRDLAAGSRQDTPRAGR